MSITVTLKEFLEGCAMSYGIAHKLGTATAVTRKQHILDYVTAKYSDLDIHAKKVADKLIAQQHTTLPSTMKANSVVEFIFDSWFSLIVGANHNHQHATKVDPVWVEATEKAASESIAAVIAPPKLPTLPFKKNPFVRIV